MSKPRIYPHFCCLFEPSPDNPGADVEDPGADKVDGAFAFLLCLIRF